MDKQMKETSKVKLICKQTFKVTHKNIKAIHTVLVNYHR